MTEELTQGLTPFRCCSSLEDESDADDEDDVELTMKSLLLLVATEFRLDFIEGDEFES